MNNMQYILSLVW